MEVAAVALAGLRLEWAIVVGGDGGGDTGVVTLGRGLFSTSSIAVAGGIEAGAS